MFTRNQIEEIKQKLLLEGIKDSQLPIANTIDGNEMLPIVQKGDNKRVGFQTFMNKIAQWTIQDIINISKNNEVYSLQEAVNAVGSINRKVGQMVTFIERESNEWRLYQFHGLSANDWDNLEYWKDQEETLSDLQDQISKIITWNEETDAKVEANADRIEDLNTLIGDNKKAIDNYTINGYKVSTNPRLNKADVGLSNVDNTADKDKPVSTATSTALAKKADLSNGKLVGTQVPVDEEDVTITNGEIKFKDRSTTNGMGYKVLRRPSNGILTQSMINQPNTIYEIRYNFDLNGATINIPENCTLKFEGGKLSNGTINGNNSNIKGTYCFDSSIALNGTFLKVDINWYKDDFIALKRCLQITDNSSKVLVISRDLNIIYTETIVTSSIIDFNGHSLYYNTNNKHDAALIEFNNTVNRTATSEEKTQCLQKLNKKDLTGYQQSLKNSLIKLNNNTITEIVRTGNRPQLLTEVVYIDNYGDLYGDIWNSNIPSDNTNIQVFTKTSSQVGIKNCNLVITKTAPLKSEYRELGFNFKGCINAIINNITVFCTNDLDIQDRENAIFNIEDSYNVLISNCFIKNTAQSTSTSTLTSSYSISLDRCINILINNVKGEALHNDNVWGITGCNYLYDFKVINSQLNRIDVHWRVVNMDIDHCTIGKYGVRYTGKGQLNITNTKFYGQCISPRSDYASYFNGTVNIINCCFYNLQNYGLVDLGIFTTKWNLRENTPIYLGGKTINISNCYIYPTADKPTLVRTYATSYDDDTATSTPGIMFPNITINSITFASNNQAGSLFAVIKENNDLDIKNIPTISINNCTDVFNNAFTNTYYKQASSLFLGDFSAILKCYNCNLNTGGEYQDSTCSFTDCIIEGFKSKTSTNNTSATYTFNNCLFKYRTLRSSGHVAFTGFFGQKLVFNNCTFDAQYKDSQDVALAVYYGSTPIYKNNKVVGWSVGKDATNIVLNNCTVTNELSEALKQKTNEFWNINKLNQSTVYYKDNQLTSAIGDAFDTWKIIR